MAAAGGQQRQPARHCGRGAGVAEEAERRARSTQRDDLERSKNALLDKARDAIIVDTHIDAPGLLSSRWADLGVEAPDREFDCAGVGPVCAGVAAGGSNDAIGRGRVRVSR